MQNLSVAYWHNNDRPTGSRDVRFALQSAIIFSAEKGHSICSYFFPSSHVRFIASDKIYFFLFLDISLCKFQNSRINPRPCHTQNSLLGILKGYKTPFKGKWRLRTKYGTPHSAARSRGPFSLRLIVYQGLSPWEEMPSAWSSPLTSI